RLAALEGGGANRPAGEVQRALGPAHALHRVVLELQRLAGCEASFGEARAGRVPGLWHVAVEFEEEPLGRACLEAARQFFLSVRADRPFDLSREVERLREL